MAPAEAGLVVLALALLLDRCVGEYPAPLHPVVWIGKLIAAFLWLAPRQGWWRQFLFGTLIAATTVVLSAAAAFAALRLVQPWPWVEIVVGALLLKASFALRALGSAAERVIEPLLRDDIEAARVALRSLCSRDASMLGPQQLLAGTVQSLAENLCDSVVAPLFYFLLFGAPGALAYRAVNTLDAMIGYRGPYEALGKFAARLDDVVNWLPARMTALLLLLAGGLTGRNVAQGWRIGLRDAGKTPSPNGGRPMAVLAGLLEVRLEKPGAYVLGDALQPLTPERARIGWGVVLCAAWLMILLCTLALLGLRTSGDWSFLTGIVHQWLNVVSR